MFRTREVAFIMSVSFFSGFCLIIAKAIYGGYRITEKGREVLQQTSGA